MKLQIILGLALWSVQLYSQDLRLSISGFDTQQTALVREGAKLAVQRMLKPAVIYCVLDYAKRSRTLSANEIFGFRNRSDLEGHVAYAILALGQGGFDTDKGRDHKVSLEIKGMSLGTKTTGEAPVGTINETNKKFSITLNKDLVNRGGHFNLANMWAEVVAHEMLHNISLRHGDASGGGWDKNYKEFVITEWGYCVEHDGARGSTSTGFGLTGGSDRPRYFN